MFNLISQVKTKFLDFVWTQGVGENVSVIGGWRKLHNQELRALSSLADITEMI